MKILLLEDDMLLNKAIVKYLNSTGHKIKSYREGKSALEDIKTKEFDLLIFDINVPNIDGLSLLEIVYKLKITTPVIFISALIDIEDISKAYELGCYDYLKKPFHLKELTLRIDKMLQIRSIPQEHTRLSKAYSFNQKDSLLFFNNSPQSLVNRQLQIIKLLTARMGTVVSYDMLRDDVWNDYSIENSTIISEVSRLKKNLKEKFIINIRSVGYKIDRVNIR